MRYQRKWITVPVVDNGVQKRKTIVKRTGINIKIWRLNVIYHEEYFYFQKNYSAITNPTNTIPIEKHLAFETNLL